MSKPKAPGETAEQRAAREAEEQRIKVMQARAEADEAAAGRSLLTRRTRRVVRLFGARRAMAGIGGGTDFTGGGTISLGGGGGSFPLGYGGFGGFGGGGGLGGLGDVGRID